MGKETETVVVQTVSEVGKKAPPPLPMGALESAELDAEALRVAVMRARAAERANGQSGHEVTGSRSLAEIAAAAGRDANALLEPPQTQPSADRSQEASDEGATVRRKSQTRKSSAVRVQVNERGRLAVGDKPLLGTLTDISLSGAFLASSRTLKPGSEVTLRFSLPVGEKGRMAPVEVRAEVRHRGRDQSGLGLRFLRMPADAMATIRRFLEENRPV